MALTDDLSDGFFARVGELGAHLGCEPIDLLRVMASEGGVRATAFNPTSSATGLIQFLPSTLAGLGWQQSMEVFRGLSAEEQMPWVGKYFEPFRRHNLNALGRVYQAVFLPASLLSDGPICGRAGPFPQAYENNLGVDTAGKGFITVEDLQAAVRQRASGPRWDEIASRAGRLVGGRATAAAPWTNINGIATRFDDRAFTDGEQVEVKARDEFGLPAAARRVMVELFRLGGRVEVYHGSTQYAGQVGWSDLAYLQLRVELDATGRFWLKGFEGAKLARMGVLAWS